MLDRARFAILALLFAGCGATQPGSREPPRTAAPRDETTVEVIREEPPPETAAETPREPALIKGVTSRSGEGENPDVRIVEPRKNAIVKHGPVKVRLAVENWPTAPRGPYVAVVVDDQAPIRVEDPAQPVDLGELQEGSHLVRAFAVLASGESIKDGHGFAWTTFHLGRRTDGWDFDDRKPFLTMNLPAGTYEGDAASAILLDVIVAHPEAGMKVKVSVGDGVSGEMTEWVPHHLQDLPDGPSTVVVELVDAQGAAVPGPFGRVTRTITVARAAAPAEAGE
jgi:hypothetical protein